MKQIGLPDRYPLVLILTPYTNSLCESARSYIFRISLCYCGTAAYLSDS